MPKRDAVVDEFGFWVSPVFDDDGVQMSSGIGQDGKEYPDPHPMEVPVGLYSDQDRMLELIQRVVHGALIRERADADEFDTPEEADDFADEDDDFQLTPYQRALMEKDLNPAKADGSGVPGGKGEPQSHPAPPAIASKPVVEPGLGNVASEEVGKSDSPVKEGVESSK